jgi:hypothetical protein
VLVPTDLTEIGCGFEDRYWPNPREISLRPHGVIVIEMPEYGFDVVGKIFPIWDREKTVAYSHESGTIVPLNPHHVLKLASTSATPAVFEHAGAEP